MFSDVIDSGIFGAISGASAYLIYSSNPVAAGLHTGISLLASKIINKPLTALSQDYKDNYFLQTVLKTVVFAASLALLGGFIQGAFPAYLLIEGIKTGAVLYGIRTIISITCHSVCFVCKKAADGIQTAENAVKSEEFNLFYKLAGAPFVGLFGAIAGGPEGAAKALDGWCQ